jgi:hypothetical protein
MLRQALAVFVLVGAAGRVAAADVKFQYTLERERAGGVIETNFLKGFDTKDGLRLKVKLNQPSYCYLIMREPTGGYRLMFPNREVRHADGLPPNEWARLPKSTFLRMGDDPGVERIYLIVAKQAVPELDQALTSDGLLADNVAIDVRDRYHVEGSYDRVLSGAAVKVKYHPKVAGPVVVVEDLSVQANPDQTRTASEPAKR